jgi:hypothetical protein
MKLTLNEIVLLDYELNGMSYIKDGVQTPVSQGLLKQKTSMKNKLYFQRLNKLVKEEVKLFEDTKKELFDKLGKQEENELVIPVENIEEFNKEYNELLSAEKNIDVSTLWSSQITPDDLASIETDENYPIFLKLVDGE